MNSKTLVGSSSKTNFVYQFPFLESHFFDNEVVSLTFISFNAKLKSGHMRKSLKTLCKNGADNFICDCRR